MLIYKIIILLNGCGRNAYEQVRKGVITSQYRQDVINVSNISRCRLICDTLFLYAKYGGFFFSTAICILDFAGFYIETKYKSEIIGSVN